VRPALASTRQRSALSPYADGPSLGILLALAGCPPGSAWDGELEAVAGLGGVALVLERPAPDGAWLWRLDEDGSERIMPAVGTLLVDPAGGPDSCYELRGPGGSLAEACATVAVAAHSSVPSPPLVLVDESLVLSLASLDPEAGLAVARGDWVVRRSRPADALLDWLDPDCLDRDALDGACWTPEPWALPGSALGDGATPALTLPPYRPDDEGVVVERVGLYLRLEDAAGATVLAGGEIEVAFAGHRLFWGDLHAHSNLSMDGCEDPDAGCASRGASAGADFFANAVAAGLDFAAITDHAEYDLLSVEGGPEVDLWEETIALVQAAEQPGFVPILGYEWTHRIKASDVLEEGDDPEDFADGFVAGHRNVLLNADSACADYRVSSRVSDPYVKAGTDYAYSVREGAVVADSLEALYDTLEAAAEACGELEVISLFHHPAYLTPNPVSWGLEDNRAWLERQVLVEIASEHGSSECRDPERAGCGFWVDPVGDTNAYVSWGSIQEALHQGYRLGFAGGTDAHDGRPGSLDDGASYTSQTWGDAHPMQFSGSVTGALLAGDLSRGAIWEALASRRTIASTALVAEASVLAVGVDGSAWLPGEVVPADRFPIRLMVVIQPAAGDRLELVEVVEPSGGAVLASGAEQRLELLIEDPGGPAVYLRARLERDGAEQRLWVSPLFIDRG
jgi:hypothetical protein